MLQNKRPRVALPVARFHYRKSKVTGKPKLSRDLSIFVPVKRVYLLQPPFLLVTLTLAHVIGLGTKKVTEQTRL